jgi:hypothetical protein
MRFIRNNGSHCKKQQQTSTVFVHICEDRVLFTRVDIL